MNPTEFFVYTSFYKQDTSVPAALIHENLNGVITLNHLHKICREGLSDGLLKVDGQTSTMVGRPANKYVITKKGVKALEKAEEIYEQLL